MSKKIISFISRILHLMRLKKLNNPDKSQQKLRKLMVQNETCQDTLGELTAKQLAALMTSIGLQVDLFDDPEPCLQSILNTSVFEPPSLQQLSSPRQSHKLYMINSLKNDSKSTINQSSQSTQDKCHGDCLSHEYVEQETEPSESTGTPSSHSPRSSNESIRCSDEWSFTESIRFNFNEESVKSLTSSRPLNRSYMQNSYVSLRSLSEQQPKESCNLSLNDHTLSSETSRAPTIVTTRSGRKFTLESKRKAKTIDTSLDSSFDCTRKFGRFTIEHEI